MSLHVVAAGNYVLGSSNFLLLNLPEGWQLFTGLHPAEVDNSIQIGDVRWVTNGRASYLLHSGQPGGKVELALRVGQGEVRRWLDACRDSERAGDPAATQLAINRHRAYYRLRPRKQSWFNRSQGDLLEVVFYCDATRRTLALEFSGPEQEQQHQALLEALGSVICH
ncbi:MAG: hypothetical protein IMW89_00835 [Ktedonobacteraceae bacterium]|nr:hypothetical protein [Ktedonobacteraceae bacterium]